MLDLALDLVLASPAGRIIELFGPESSGKTTLALYVIASAEHEGGIAAFIDAEHLRPTPLWAKNNTNGTKKST